MKTYKIYTGTLNQDFKFFTKGHTLRLEDNNNGKFNIISNTEFQHYFDTILESDINNMFSNIQYLKTDTYKTIY